MELEYIVRKRRFFSQNYFSWKEGTKTPSVSSKMWNSIHSIIKNIKYCDKAKSYIKQSYRFTEMPHLYIQLLVFNWLRWSNKWLENAFLSFSCNLCIYLVVTKMNIINRYVRYSADDEEESRVRCNLMLARSDLCNKRRLGNTRRCQ